MVEQLPFKELVPGSNPGGRTKDRNQLQTNIMKVEDAIGILSSEKDTTGNWRGYTPDSLLPMVSPNTKIAQDSIQAAIQETLRPTLGAQFTENEGKRIMGNQFDKKLSSSENLRRATNLHESMMNKIKLNDALADYADAHRGSDAGFPYDQYTGSSQHVSPPTAKTKGKVAAPAPGGGGRPRIEYNATQKVNRLTWPDGKVEMRPGPKLKPEQVTP